MHQYQVAVELSRWKGLSTAKSTCVVMRDVCIRKDLNPHVVLSGGTDISFQSVMNCEVCIRKELYAECRVVGGTAVFQGIVEPMTRNPYDSTVITRSCVSLWSRSVTARTLNNCGKLEVERAALYTVALRCKWAAGRSRTVVPQEVRPVVPVTTSSHGPRAGVPTDPQSRRRLSVVPDQTGCAHPTTSGCVWVFL